MIAVLDLGLAFLNMFLGQLANGAPANVIAAVAAAIQALLVHKNDLITKAALEANRG